MAIELALTDTQLAVISRLRASISAADLDELAVAAIEHDRRAAPDPRWRESRPHCPGTDRDAGDARGGAGDRDGVLDNEYRTTAR